MEILIGIGVGLGVGLVLTAGVFLGLHFYIKRKSIKTAEALIEKGKFLLPLDKRDVDVEAWKDYIDFDQMDEDLENLNKNIFKKDKNEIKQE